MNRKIDMPTLKFSRWISWNKRRENSKYRFPGVYMIAITDKNLAGTKPEYKDAVYIGMSRSRGGLLQRWQQFHNTINGKSGHSGGKTIREDPEYGLYLTWSKQLYVCAMAIECDVKSKSPTDLRKIGQVVYLEYEAFARYSAAPNTLKKPKFNKH